jgi:peptidoglycan/xylan/chitin deacetylase (PgdA/CDA1 family)
MEAALRDWLLGCNPWGTSMIVELPRGGTYPHAPHSNYVMEGVGMPTGGLVDGPVYATIFNSLKGVTLAQDKFNVEGNTYDLFQPGDVVFHDNTHDYSTNEPTMDGTASLTFPFSFYEMEGKGESGNYLWDEGAIVRGDASKKQLTLVFTADDKADGAELIISTLNKQGIKGAFFFTGRFLDLYPNVVKRLVADGHYVGSHSYGHLLYCDWAKRDSLLVTKQQFCDDIIKSYEALARFGITPQQARWIIPPYEWHNATVAAWAREMGLQLVNFSPGTASSMDYTYPGISGSQHEMCCYNRRILHSGISLATRICKYIVFIKCYNKNSRCSITARCCLIDLSQVLVSLNNINMLFLEILCRRCKPSGFKDVIEPCPVYFSFTVFLT